MSHQALGARIVHTALMKSPVKLRIQMYKCIINFELNTRFSLCWVVTNNIVVHLGPV